jgi:catechol 2,3-dioxygenase-like lactoylglutathione lyase family enzyme
MLRLMTTDVQPVVKGLSVVYLYVRDLDRSLAFYRDVLGIPLEGSDESWVEATLGSTRFALHALHAGADEPRSGTIHVDFAVDDIDEAAARLEAAGVSVGEIQRERYGSHCTFRDPDGYELELFQPAG